jgi:hypothetical protein
MPAEIQASFIFPDGSTMPPWLRKELIKVDLMIQQFNLNWKEYASSYIDTLNTIKDIESFNAFKSDFTKGVRRNKYTIENEFGLIGVKIIKAEKKSCYSVIAFQRDKEFELGELVIRINNIDDVIYNLGIVCGLLNKLDRLTVASYLVGVLSEKSMSAKISLGVYNAKYQEHFLVDSNRKVLDKRRIFNLEDEEQDVLLDMAQKLIDKNGASSVSSGHLGSAKITLQRYVYRENDTAINDLSEYERKLILPKKILSRDTKQLKWCRPVQTNAGEWDEEYQYYLKLMKCTDLINVACSDEEYQESDSFAVFLDDIAIPQYKACFSSLDKALRFFRKHNQKPGLRIGIAMNG